MEEPMMKNGLLSETVKGLNMADLFKKSWSKRGRNNELILKLGKITFIFLREGESEMLNRRVCQEIIASTVEIKFFLSSTTPFASY